MCDITRECITAPSIESFETNRSPQERSFATWKFKLTLPWGASSWIVFFELISSLQEKRVMLQKVQAPGITLMTRWAKMIKKKKAERNMAGEMNFDYGTSFDLCRLWEGPKEVLTPKRFGTEMGQSRHRGRQVQQLHGWGKWASATQTMTTIYYIRNGRMITKIWGECKPTRRYAPMGLPRMNRMLPNPLKPIPAATKYLTCMHT